MTLFPHAGRRLTEEIAPTTLQQPKPKPPKRPYVLQEFVDPIHPDRPKSVQTFVSDWLDRSPRRMSRAPGDHLEGVLLRILCIGMRTWPRTTSTWAQFVSSSQIMSLILRITCGGTVT